MRREEGEPQLSKTAPFSQAKQWNAKFRQSRRQGPKNKELNLCHLLKNSRCLLAPPPLSIRSPSIPSSPVALSLIAAGSVSHRS